MHCEKEQEFPGFRRYTVSDGERSTLVDLVHEPVEQLVPLDDKPVVDGVRIDPLQELVANKLSALLGRGETKDLVDTTELEMLEPIDEAALESIRDDLVELLRRLSFPERSE